MNRESEVKDIIDELFYKDVAGIIKSYLFIKCKECKGDCIEENSYDSYDDKHYCYKCVKKSNVRMCSKCCKYYSVGDGLFVCCICLRICCVFCSDCFVANKVKLHTYEDNPHYIYYWLGLDRLQADNVDIDLINEIVDS